MCYYEINSDLLTPLATIAAALGAALIAAYFSLAQIRANEVTKKKLDRLERARESMTFLFANIQKLTSGDNKPEIYTDILLGMITLEILLNRSIEYQNYLHDGIEKLRLKIVNVSMDQVITELKNASQDINSFIELSSLSYSLAWENIKTPKIWRWKNSRIRKLEIKIIEHVKASKKPD